MNESALLLKEETAAQEPSVGVCRNTGIHHVGLYAKDPSAMAEFYRDVLGMQIVGGISADDPQAAR
jgi:catechol-2,3-dioxygenase